MFGRRPVATSSSSTVIVSAPTLQRPPRRPAADTPSSAASSRTSTPSARSAAATRSPANGSSAGSSRGPRCSSVTAEPSRRKAWASSQPTTPPPSTPSRRRDLLGRGGVARGPDAHRVQPRHRRPDRHAAGAQRHRPPGGDLLAVDRHRPGPGEPRPPAADRDAGALGPLDLAGVVPAVGDGVPAGQHGQRVEGRRWSLAAGAPRRPRARCAATPWTACRPSTSTRRRAARTR